VLARADETSPDLVEVEHVAQARDGRLYHQSRDTHYDQISAFIKSVRGSDPDGALYWLVTMLEGGESPRFLARRLVILASEDIGLADPMGLVLADAAARTVEFIGLPEGRLTLAHATITLALMPKSNSVTRALGAVTRAVQEGGLVEVPDHLRGSNYRARPSRASARTISIRTTLHVAGSPSSTSLTRSSVSATTTPASTDEKRRWSISGA